MSKEVTNIVNLNDSELDDIVGGAFNLRSATLFHESSFAQEARNAA